MIKIADCEKARELSLAFFVWAWLVPAARRSLLCQQKDVRFILAPKQLDLSERGGGGWPMNRISFHISSEAGVKREKMAQRAVSHLAHPVAERGA